MDNEPQAETPQAESPGIPSTPIEAQPAPAPSSFMPPPRGILDLQKLKRLRKGLRLTQAELAQILNIHRTYLVLIEKGKKIPSVRLERQILEFMEKAEKENITPADFWRSITPNASAVASQTPARYVPVVSWAAAGLAKAYEDLC